MNIISFEQHTMKRRKMQIYFTIALIAISSIIAFLFFISNDINSLQSFVEILIVCLLTIAIIYKFIAPIFLTKTGLIPFLFFLGTSSTVICILYFLLFEFNILQYPASVQAHLVPTNMKLAFFFCLGLLLFYSALSSFLYFNTFQLSNERYHNLLEVYTMEINEMRMKTNPFFLNLNLLKLNSLIKAEDYEKALSFNVEISSLLNKQLSHLQAEYITIEEDLDWLKHYFQTQLMLSNSNFDFIIELDNLDLNLQHVPPLLLQPIVENYFSQNIDQQLKHHISLSIADLNLPNQQGVIVDLSDVYESRIPIDFRETFIINILEKRIELINKIKKFSIQLEKTTTETSYSFSLTIIER
jgi:sensor histidine kinase YesM